MRLLLVVALLLAVLAGCASSISQAPTSTAANPSSFGGETSGDAPSTAPDPTPSQQKLGDVIQVQCGDVGCMSVSVDKAMFANVYEDATGAYASDVPGKGNVYLAFQVTYKATRPDATYGSADWSVYVDDNVREGLTSVRNGPKPELPDGSLPVGQSVSGWVVQEVPATGRVVVAFQPDGPEIFEVVVRSR